MADIKVVFDSSLITVGDLLDMEEGTTSQRMEVLARFVQNGDGKYMTPENGMVQIRKLTLDQLKDVIANVTESLQEQADPN